MSNFRIIFPLVLCLWMKGAIAQSIHGKVTDEQTGEGLIGAHIILSDENKGVQTDEYGQFHIRVSEFPARMVCSYVGYQSDTIIISEFQEEGFHFSLFPVTLEEIIVTEDHTPPKERIGVLNVPVEQLMKNKFFLGQEDIIRSLASLPGVSLGNTARNGLYVRGSDPEHNLILLDGTPVYNTGHLFGLFSTFISSTVKDVKLYKGEMPARYGSRLASVIDVNTREGNRNNYSSEYSIGLLSASGHWEGPVGEDASVMGAFRSSYLGLALLPARILYEREQIDNTINYWMYDLNLKGNWDPTDKDHFFISFYHGNDVLPFRSKDAGDENIRRLRWGNTTTSVRYSRIWSSDLFSRIQLYNAQYTNIVRYTGLERDARGKGRPYSDIRDRSSVWETGFFIQNDWLVSDIFKLHFGYQLQRYLIRPNQITFQINEMDRSEMRSSHHQYVPSWQNSFFGEGIFQPKPWLDLNIGIRTSGYFVKEKKNQWFPEPRLSASINFSPRHAVKVSYFKSSQFLHQLTHHTFGAPSDFWVPTKGEVLPQKSQQWSLGYSTSLFAGDYDFTMEAYTKKMKHLINFQQGTKFLLLLDRSWDEVVLHDGIGEAKGLEWFLHKKEGRWNGWLGYSLSWSRRKFDDLNRGQWFYSTYDRRHDLEIFLNYRISKKWELSGSWQYQSGHRISIPTAETFGDYFYTEKNNWSYPPFHQLNIGAVRTKQKSERKKTVLSFGLYNAYSHFNPWFIELENEFYKERDEQTGEEVVKAGRMALEGFSVFNFLPYISYKIKLD